MRRLIKIFAALVLLLMVSIFALWSWHHHFIPGPEVGEVEQARLARHTMDDPGPPPYRISYLTAGDPKGPRLIYVHGTPGSALAWADYLVRPLPGWESLAYDRPGFGQTKPARAEPSLERQAQALEKFLVKRRGRRPVLIGHSLGGAVVCQAAVGFPDRISGLVILAGSLDPELEHIAWYQKVAEWGFMPRLLPQVLVNANREVLPLKNELARLGPRLKSITCPVVIVHGAEDKLVPEENAEYIKQKLVPGRLTEFNIIPGQNHFLPWNNRPAVLQAIEKIISQKQ